MGERVSKKVRQGTVEVDYEENSLVVNYHVERVAMDESNRVIEVLESKPETRRVKLKQLSVDKNMAQLAADIVEKCSYIHPSRTEEVEQLLIKLRKYQLNQGQSSKGDDRGGKDREREVRDTGGERERDRAARDGPSSSAGAGAGAGGAAGREGRQQSSSTRGGGTGAAEQREDRDRDRDRDREREERVTKSRQDESTSGPQSVVSDAAMEKENELVKKRRQKEREAEEKLPPAHINNIDDYLDMLYQVGGNSEEAKAESLRIQVKGTAMILLLCRDVMNLETLIQNSTVMGALTRVFSEEFKKSVELTFNILRIFLAFSNFMEMHGLLSNYRVGMLTMKAIDYEVQRWLHRSEERDEKESKYRTIIEKARETGDGAAGEERVKKLRENEKVKQRVHQMKQDKMLFVALYLLINLAEDVSVERKMLNKDLLLFLENMLERSHGDLLVLTVTFLKKLSIYEENKDLIIKTDIIRKISRFIPCSFAQLVQMSLQLLFNLSFDATLRSQMLQVGLVPKLVGLLKTANLRAKTLKLLYHLSVSDECKLAIAQGDGMPLLMGLVVNFPNPTLARELAALAINLSHVSQNVERMVANRGLNLLMDRLDNDYQERDQGLLKVIRNVSYWTMKMQQQAEKAEDYKYRGIWAPHFKLILDLVTDTDNHDTLVELVGVLANMTSFDVPANTSWSRLCREYNLLSLFSKLLIPGMAQNDLILEIVMLISAIASDVNACDMIASSNLIGLLYQTWKEKSEDIEIKLQLIYCFHKLFLRQTSREEAMYSTRIVVDIIECLSDPCAAVRACADEVTDFVLEYDRKENGELGQLGLQIRKKRFEGYNTRWLTQFDLLNGGAGSRSNFDNGNVLRGPSGRAVAGAGAAYADDDDDDDDDDDLDESDEFAGVVHGSMEWKMLMRQKEQRLALDMSDVNAMSRKPGPKVSASASASGKARQGGRNQINDDASSGGEEWDGPGRDWQ